MLGGCWGNSSFRNSCHFDLQHEPSLSVFRVMCSSSASFCITNNDITVSQFPNEIACMLEGDTGHNLQVSPKRSLHFETL